jgi:hypothetical protein
MSPIDTLIHSNSARESLIGETSEEIEKRLGPPDTVHRNGTEWYYHQEDVSRLWPMELSRSLHLIFADGRVVSASNPD